MAKWSIAAAIFSTIIEHCSSYEIAVAVSRFWEPNNGVRSSIAESDADIEVGRTPKITNDLSGTTSFPVTSNKVTISSLEVKTFSSQAFHSLSPSVRSRRKQSFSHQC